MENKLFYRLKLILIFLVIYIPFTLNPKVNVSGLDISIYNNITIIKYHYVNNNTSSIIIPYQDYNNKIISHISLNNVDITQNINIKYNKNIEIILNNKENLKENNVIEITLIHK